MLSNPHFYNRTIRKIVVAFGTMFNDVQLVRYSKDGLTSYEITKVPLSYGAKEKYMTRITSDPTLTKSIATLVPRMSFDLVGMTYDSTRKQQTTMQNFGYSSGKFAKQYAPIPYNFDFNLSIYVRNTEDGTQILEQILPFFTPDFTVTVDFISKMDQTYDMPVLLNSVSPEIDYEGDMMATRLIVWNLTFTAKAYIWPPVYSNDDKGLIKQANTNIYTDHTDLSAQRVYVNYSTGHGVYTTGEDITVDAKGITGKVLYFSNTATGVLVLTDLSDRLSANDVVNGVYSNASFKISSVDSTLAKTAIVIDKVKPSTANVNEPYGFEETFVEWPNTLI
jgi:FlaG/FlaF family flagellin (archaellin)